MFNQDIVTAINVRKNHFKIYCLKKNLIKFRITVIPHKQWLIAEKIV